MVCKASEGTKPQGLMIRYVSRRCRVVFGHYRLQDARHGVWRKMCSHVEWCAAVHSNERHVQMETALLSISRAVVPGKPSSPNLGWRPNGLDEGLQGGPAKSQFSFAMVLHGNGIYAACRAWLVRYLIVVDAIKTQAALYPGYKRRISGLDKRMGFGPSEAWPPARPALC